MARRLFGHPAWALLAQLLFALDFMHFTQSRLGTVDVFMVFFVLVMVGAFWRWFNLMLEEPVLYGKGKTHKSKLAARTAAQSLPLEAYGWLALSGLGLALGAATKWNALYPALGMAGLFLYALVRRWQRRGGGAWIIRTLATALAFFILVPIAIYVATYIPYFLVPGHQGGLAEVWSWQQKMYAYHRDLNASHDFASPWWQWPLMIKPVWYYTARDTMPNGITATVAAFGNPAIWWICLPVVFAGLVMAIQQRDRVMLFLLVIFLSQYLPWIVVPRKVTFIYHFFPMVPTLVLMIIRMFQLIWEQRLAEGRSLRILRLAYGGYFALAAGLFLLFYPVISGAHTTVWYVDHVLKWLPGWYF